MSKMTFNAQIWLIYSLKYASTNQDLFMIPNIKNET
jgi:hypothetical protein